MGCLKISYHPTLDLKKISSKKVLTSIQSGKKARRRYKFGFNGQEKDNEIYGAGNSMTAEYWLYDPRLGRRFNTDPKPNPSISVYACFANNPIFYTDVDGDTVKGDMGAYNKVKSYVKNIISDVTNDIKEVSAKIEERKVAGKSTRRLEKKQRKLESKRDAYQGILDEYSALEQSEQVYNINTNSSLVNAEGSTTFNSSNGYVDINISSGADIYRTLSHELKHAFQFESHTLSLRYDGQGGGLLYDIEDEVEAYRRSQMFGYYSGEKINASWVRINKGYTKLDKNQRAMQTPMYPPAPITYEEYMKYQIYNAGKLGKSPTDVFKGWKKYEEQGKTGQPFTK